MSKQDAAVMIKGYADLIATMAHSGAEVTDEALYVVWNGLSDIAIGLSSESADCAPLTPRRTASK